MLLCFLKSFSLTACFLPQSVHLSAQTEKLHVATLNTLTRCLSLLCYTRGQSTFGSSAVFFEPRLCFFTQFVDDFWSLLISLSTSASYSFFLFSINSQDVKAVAYCFYVRFFAEIWGIAMILFNASDCETGGFRDPVRRTASEFVGEFSDSKLAELLACDPEALGLVSSFLSAVSKFLSRKYFSQSYPASCSLMNLYGRSHFTINL